MSEKNFMAYGDAESVLTGYANRIKKSPTTFVGTTAEWNGLTAEQKAVYTLVNLTDDGETGSENAYTTSEQKTGEVWIDGKPIYRKVVDCGNLPNATTKDVAHGITGIDTVISIYGMASSSALNTYFPLPYANTSQTESVVILVIGANIHIVDAYNFSGYTAKVVLEYTKTAD